MKRSKWTGSLRSFDGIAELLKPGGLYYNIILFNACLLSMRLPFQNLEACEHTHFLTEQMNSEPSQDIGLGKHLKASTIVNILPP